MNRTFVRNTVIQALLLMALWLLLSGRYDGAHISYGVLSVIIVVSVNYPLRKRLFSLEKHAAGLQLHLARLIAYIPWLLWQIAVSSLQVAYVVLHPKCPIDPALVRFKTRLGNTSSKVILGNSITLTPGTITLEIEDDTFLVHALMDVSSTGIVDGTLPNQVAKLYEKRPGQILGKVEIIKSSDAL